MKKEILICVMLALSLAVSVQPVSASEQAFAAAPNESRKVTINFFYAPGCPYCAKEKQFFEDRIENYQGVTINKYDVTKSGSLSVLDELAEEHDVEIDRIAVPMTFVNGSFFMGYTPSIGNEIEEIVKKKLGVKTELPSESGKTEEEAVTPLPGEKDEVYLPIFGEVDISKLSLPVLTVVLGSLDGLNVCSLGALLLILAIVVGFDSRKKTFIYGGLFILTTALVYGLLVFVWYGLVRLFVSYIDILSIIIGAAGIIGGAYFFKMFLNFYKYGPTCKMKKNKYFEKLHQKVRDFVSDPEKGFLAVAGVLILFAAAVTLIELPCSFALPLVFSGILADAGVSTAASAVYIIVYLFFYMLDEIIIFLGAVYMKDIWYGPGKSITWMTLFASLVLFGLGFYYIYPLLPV